MLPSATKTSSNGTVHPLLGVTLNQALAHPTNNILLLRLFAAGLVVYGHSYVLSGPDVPDADIIHMLLPRTHSHLVGVALFFTLSGFLIAKSYANRRSTLQYLWNRTLRIFPALLVVLAATALIIGPISTTITLSQYFSAEHAGPGSYFISNATLLKPQQTLPGVFGTNPVPNYVNGSLWTIRYEFALYLLVPAIGALRLRALSATLVAGCILALLVAGRAAFVEYIGANFLAYQLAGCFLIGALAYALRRRFYLSTPILGVITCISLLLRHTPASWLVVIYFAFWVSYIPKLPRMYRDIDLSYGIYLWAFPIQQLIVPYLNPPTPLVLTSFALAVSAVIAGVSWLTIERPALMLKTVRIKKPDAR